MHKVYTKIDSIAGNVITVAAEGIKNEDLAVLSTRDGESLASVIKLDGSHVSLQVFAGGKRGLDRRQCEIPRTPDGGLILR